MPGSWMNRIPEALPRQVLYSHDQREGSHIFYRQFIRPPAQSTRIMCWMNWKTGPTMAWKGIFHARNPWVSYHELFPIIEDIVGGLERIVVMNQLTVNLPVNDQFCRPTNPDRFKIICEAKAFPSDQYALQSEFGYMGWYPRLCVEVGPRPERSSPRKISCRPSGNIKTSSAWWCSEVWTIHGTGIRYGRDHQSGTWSQGFMRFRPGPCGRKRHHWNYTTGALIFACWCSYKYLNSPGGVAGAFIHERHITNKNIPGLAGWWGHDKENRFNMGLTSTRPLRKDGNWVTRPYWACRPIKPRWRYLRKQEWITLPLGQQLSEYLFYILDDIQQTPVWKSHRGHYTFRTGNAWLPGIDADAERR